MSDEESPTTYGERISRLLYFGEELPGLTDEERAEADRRRHNLLLGMYRRGLPHHLMARPQEEHNPLELPLSCPKCSSRNVSFSLHPVGPMMARMPVRHEMVQVSFDCRDCHHTWNVTAKRRYR